MSLIWSERVGWVDPERDVSRFVLPASGTVACWDFTRGPDTLADTVSGVVLTLGSSNANYYAGYGATPRATGYCTARYTYLYAPPTPALSITGDVTIETIVTFQRGHVAGTAPSNGYGLLVSCAGAASTDSADNMLYGLITSYYGYRLSWLQEHGSSTDDLVAATYGPGILEPHNLAVTRSALAIGIWLDGEQIATGTVPSTTSGGANSYLAIGSHPHFVTANGPAACWHSVAISNYARTDLAERYLQTLGRS